MPLSVCGGIGLGPIASGGNLAPFTTLTQTIALGRDVPCGSVVHVVCGVITTGSDSSLSLGSVTDSTGGTYLVFTSTKALIGLIRQEFTDQHGAHRSMMIGSALRSVAAGELSAGDTITITWVSDFTGARMIAMAFALTGVGDDAVEQSGDTRYGNGASYPDFGTSTDLKYADTLALVSADLESAFLSGFVAHGDGLASITPAEGRRLGSLVTTDINDSSMYLSVSAIPDAAGSSFHDPGWSWTNPARAAIVNYQPMDLAQTGVIFDGGWTHRLDE